MTDENFRAAIKDFYYKIGDIICEEIKEIHRSYPTLSMGDLTSIISGQVLIIALSFFWEKGYTDADIRLMVNGMTDKFLEENKQKFSE